MSMLKRVLYLFLIPTFFLLGDLNTQAGMSGRWVYGVVNGMDADSVTLVTSNKKRIKVLRKFFKPNENIVIDKNIRVFVYRD